MRSFSDALDSDLVFSWIGGSSLTQEIGNGQVFLGLGFKGSSVIGLAFSRIG